MTRMMRVPYASIPSRKIAVLEDAGPAQGRTDPTNTSTVVPTFDMGTNDCMGHNGTLNGILTFMSIRLHIARLEAQKKLFRHDPKTRHPAKRRLYFTEAAMKDLTDMNSAVNVLGLGGQIRADLLNWTSGGLVHCDEKGEPRFLKPLCPPPPPSEIWELRVTEPRVQVRLFCRFAEPNTLIMNKFYTRGLLGKRGSKEWQQARELCAKTWDELFPSFTPHTGRYMREYVTENFDDFEVCPQ